MEGSYVRFDSQSAFFPGAKIHRVQKAWGEEQWIVNRAYCGKKLILKKNRRCSMHTHREKDEVFYVQSGAVQLELAGKSYMLKAGDFVHVPAGAAHRFTGVEDSEIFEFSTTHREEDSFRTELSGHVDPARFNRETALLSAFKKASVLIVGDAMLDTYLHGSVDRVSPEAPIPVVHYKSERSVPGGAANAALNVAALGGKATLLAVRGDDKAGDTLEKLLKAGNVRSAMLIDAGHPTTQKQRVVADRGQQIVRLDYEHVASFSPAAERTFLRRFKSLLIKHDAVLISDYAKGVLSPATLSACITAARKRGVPVVLDPKPLGIDYAKHAKGITAVTPNHKEMQTLLGHRGSAETLAKQLATMLGGSVVLTLGAGGMLVQPKGGKATALPALAREVSDVSGAGDTVAATLTLALACGARLEDGADLANRAASVVVGKQGTATVTPEELFNVL